MPVTITQTGRVGSTTSKFIEFEFTTGRSVGPTPEIFDVRLTFDPANVRLAGGGFRGDFEFNDRVRVGSGRFENVEFPHAGGPGRGPALLAKLLSTFDAGGSLPSPRFP